MEQKPEETKPEAPEATPAPASTEAHTTSEGDSASSPSSMFDVASITPDELSTPIKVIDNPPPDNVSGTDAEAKRGRGRPRKDGSAAKARDYAAERARAAANKAGIKTAPVAATPEQVNADAIAGAALIVQTLDFMRSTISSGEVDKDLTPEQAANSATTRAATEAAWRQYLESTNAKLPPWALAVITSGAYLLPAFRTPTAREKLGFAWLRCKEWFTKRMRRE